MSLQEEFARNLRVAMAEKNMTSVELFGHTGLARSTISKIRKGKVTGIEFSTLEKLSEGLGISVSELFEQKKD